MKKEIEIIREEYKQCINSKKRWCYQEIISSSSLSLESVELVLSERRALQSISSYSSWICMHSERKLSLLFIRFASELTNSFVCRWIKLSIKAGLLLLRFLSDWIELFFEALLFCLWFSVEEYREFIPFFLIYRVDGREKSSSIHLCNLAL